MSYATNNLDTLAAINLFYASAEISVGGDSASILRALDHIQQAEALLKIRLKELKHTDDETDEVEGSEEAA